MCVLNSRIDVRGGGTAAFDNSDFDAVQPCLQFLDDMPSRMSGLAQSSGRALTTTAAAALSACASTGPRFAYRRAQQSPIGSFGIIRNASSRCHSSDLREPLSKATFGGHLRAVVRKETLGF